MERGVVGMDGCMIGNSYTPQKTPAWENQAGAVAVGRKKSELDGFHSVPDGDAFVIFDHSAAGKVVAGRVAVVNGSTDLTD